MHADWQHRLVVVGLAWLLVLFVVGGLAANHAPASEVGVQMQPESGARVSDDGRVLVIGPGSGVATLRFTLPPPDPSASRWVVWMGRDPLASLWLQGVGWTSAQRQFFAPTADEGVMPGGFLLALPGNWQGAVVLQLHASSDARVALRPRVMREASAMQLARRGIALESAIYAGLFVLALLSLALYSAARERSFLTLFACTTAGLLLLAAQNGHLYQVPGLGLLAHWGVSGLWTLSLLFAASALQALLRYAGLRGAVGARRWLDRYCLLLVGLACLCLLDLQRLDRVLSPLVWLALLGAGVGAVATLAGALRRHVPVATATLLMTLVTATAVLIRAALSHGWLLDAAWTRFGYQVATVVTLAMLMVGLLSRIGEFRHERDRDQLARLDSERRMAREAARANLSVTLQTRLRGMEATDIEWVAFHLLLEHLAPQVPVTWAAVIAYGYHGHDLLVVEPGECKPCVHDLLGLRKLGLKRLALQGVPLQQAARSGDSDCIEALLPLAVRAPGWGVLLLQRAGSDGFSTEEMSLAGEFLRLATLQADDAVAAAQLRRSAEHDALTGTFNRRSMDQWLLRGFSQASEQRQPLSLLFIDIDHFKSVNDRLGHSGGDQCLREVAAALRGALEDGDILGRYGGEEFIVLLPGRGGAEAREIAERLRAAVERREFRHDNHSERLTVSIGVATRLEAEREASATVKRADQALYAAKRAGRNCVQVAPAVFT
jgi:diguanylate cyclase (GGDEF)-like protein